jgi:sarcosine oxidase subunit alpha
MTQAFRHPTEGDRIDRSRPITFRFNSQELTGYEGDTLASALLANGIHHVSRSVNLGRPRGIVSAGSEEPSGIVAVQGPHPETLVPATTVELRDGLVARSIAGRGRLGLSTESARYDAVHAHCDVLVVGAGETGRAAATNAARDGARVILADEWPWRGDPPPEGVRTLARTTVVGHYEHNFLLAVQRHPTPRTRERVWRIRAGRVLLATGAHERLIAFADNDRPGVMLAGAARTYLQRYGVLVGRKVVVYTTNDSGCEVAEELALAGVELSAVVDTRCSYHVVAVEGFGRVTGVTVAAPDGGRRSFEADALLVSGGWSPVLHLYSQAGGVLRYDETAGAMVPAGCRQTVEYVSELPSGGDRRWIVESDDYSAHFVDLQRDVTVADVRRATGAGLRSVEHVKRYTTAGTAHDQGKTSGLLTTAVTADALGLDPGALGLTTFRPPYLPVSFETLAGRERGDLFDPVRVTPIHRWHVDHSALWENVGQWRRAWYYPRDGEDLDAAVRRECVAARTGVAMQDVSTLGKIEVQGPDAAEFLDRLYTNMISTLAIGSIRYGVMCGVDGMILDDGTVARLAADRFFVTTSTGNAARVLDWMEEWLQTEWPHLRVWCTSVTEQWATVALVGPLSRPVLAALAPTLAVDAAAFPFMTWRDTVVGGMAARVCRISFSGELAYEISVPAWDGLALWEAVFEGGMEHGIAPYGTETMHVLRAEKGYPIIGQDSDGTCTPQDLGLGWAVSRSKVDFVGKRSFSRADTARADRKHLVGLLPADPSFLLPEGAHLVESEELPAPPVPYLGHVTSSYHSAALGRSFALGLVQSGRDRLGSRVWSPLDGRMVPVTVVSHVLYDPEGARRDG